MIQLISRLHAFFTARQDGERGATMVEYGLMLALIAVICVGVITTIGTDLLAKFNVIAGAI